MTTHTIHHDDIYHRPWNVYNAAGQFVADFKTEAEAKAFVAEKAAESERRDAND